MTTFSPSAESTTRTQIATSRVAFAQLEGQNFHPSKAFGPEWTPAAGGDAREAAERARGVKVVSPSRLVSAPLTDGVCQTLTGLLCARRPSGSRFS